MNMINANPCKFGSLPITNKSWFLTHQYCFEGDRFPDFSSTNCDCFLPQYFVGFWTAPLIWLSLITGEKFNVLNRPGTAAFVFVFVQFQVLKTQVCLCAVEPGTTAFAFSSSPSSSQYFSASSYSSSTGDPSPSLKDKENHSLQPCLAPISSMAFGFAF